MYVVMRDFRLPSTMCSVCATRIAIVMPRQLILQKHVSVDRSTFDMLVAHHRNVIANMSGSVNVPYSWYISLKIVQEDAFGERVRRRKRTQASARSGLHGRRQGFCRGKTLMLREESG